MNILQFLRIFWARRMIVLIAIVCSFVGAFAVVSIVQPRYEAVARVVLSMALRPDPVTGEVLNAKQGEASFEAQIELARAYSVTGPVVDALGWLTDPRLIQEYSQRDPSDTRDFRRWLAEKVEESTQAKIEGAGSALAITYRGPTPQIATIGAETLRKAFLDASLAQRISEAQANAKFFNAQAEEARKMAETAENAKAAYEKVTGIIMQGRESDLDSERLAALAGQSTMGMGTGASIAAPSGNSAAMQLAQLDAQIADAAKRLGPNHPEMQAARTRRELMAKVAAQEAASQNAVTSGAAGAAAISRALQEQKARVIGQRDQVERLRQLQAEVDLRRDQYRSSATKAAQYTIEASVTDSGVSPLGIVVTPSSPKFPNKPLILGGSLGLGFGLGMALALLLELLNRRVRSVDDLKLSSDIHCIAVIEEPSGKSAARRFRRALRNLFPRWTGAPT
jgi:polysaccharide biosynthesis transport protein